MVLLQASGISMAIDKMSFEGLTEVLIFLIVAIFLVFRQGITLRWGDKEFVIGGLRKLLLKKEQDTHLKENLKRFADGVDYEMQADLFELIDDIEKRVHRLKDNDHCNFALCRLGGLIKTDLYNRVRRNDLRERLSEESREQFSERILSNIQKGYDPFQAKAAEAKNDVYQMLSEIKNNIKFILVDFFDGANTILIRGYRKKIKKYEEEKRNFKTSTARKYCCDDTIAKNHSYIEILTKNIGGENAQCE